MKDVDEMNHEYAMKCIGSFYQVLNEVLIPYTVKRDFGKEFGCFEPFEALDCMEDEVTSVVRVVELYDALVSNPVLFFEDFQLECLLQKFLLFVKGFADEDDDGSDTDHGSLTTDDKAIIEQFICEMRRKNG